MFPPNAHVRAELTVSRQGKNSPRLSEHLKDLDMPYQARSVSWAQSLKSVIHLDTRTTNIKYSQHSGLVHSFYIFNIQAYLNLNNAVKK
ncbi:hypothetical protein KUL113_36100 [Tenacibaculum sp. KUL113]|nr:hypothetical protein KUL113_36100 [Tenacibaculum sp. KUL113]